MGRVVIANATEAPDAAFPKLAGISISGGVATKAVVAEDSRPLILWQHTMAPGSEIRLTRPRVGHAAYILDGAVSANGKQLTREGVAIVAHGGDLVLRCEKTPATLLHFHRPDDYATPPLRAGGCVHVLNKADAPKYDYAETKDNVTNVTKGIVYADSGCPTCELWFHMNEIANSDVLTPRHYHTEDEIIVVVKGAMTVGRRNLTPATALAVDADTVYTFTSGEDGLSFINFRACDPWFGRVVASGEPPPPISEREAVHALMGKQSLERIHELMNA